MQNRKTNMTKNRDKIVNRDISKKKKKSDIFAISPTPSHPPSPLFHHPGMVNENVLKSDFEPLCDGTTRRRSLADLRLLEGM